MFFKKAVPVWAREADGQKNILLTFTATLVKTEAEYKFSCAADNFYRLMINGNFIYYGPEKCGKAHWRVDTFDITDKLCNGKNDISIDVIHYGVNSFAYENQAPFLQAEILCNGEPLLYTKDSFECRRNLSKEQIVQRFSYQRPMLESYFMPFEYSAPLELYEVKNIKLLKNRAGYPHFSPVYPSELIASGTFEPLPCDEWEHFLYHGIDGDGFTAKEIGTMHSDIIKNIKETSLVEKNKKIDSSYEDVFQKGDWSLMRLPAENTGFWSVKLEAKQDSVLYIAYSEVLSEDGAFDPIRGNMCSFVPLHIKKGKHMFYGLEPSVVNYIKLFCFSGIIKVSGLCLLEYKNPAVEGIFLNSGDEALDRVFNAAVSTFAQNAVDIYSDCPSRERAGWLCDSFFTSRTEKELTGKSEIEHDFLENFIIAPDFDLPDGMLPMCYPASSRGGGKTIGFIPNWAMWFVLELKEYLERSNDTELIAAAKTRVYGLMKYFEAFENENRLLQSLDGWIFVEWSRANEWVQDLNVPTNMLYSKMLKTVAALYGDTLAYEKAEKIKRYLIKNAYNGNMFCDNAVFNNEKNLVFTENISETCQYYAFFCDIASKETFSQLYKTMTEDFGPGRKGLKKHPTVEPSNAFIGNYLRLDMLLQNMELDRVREETVEYFDYMAKKTGTLWENDGSYASCNHGFASYAACIARKLKK